LSVKRIVYLEDTRLYSGDGVYLGEVFALEDGFKYFWPEAKSSHGAWSAHILRAIADLLDEMNAPWIAELTEALSGVGGGGGIVVLGDQPG
jgi:hypothetical protein